MVSLLVLPALKIGQVLGRGGADAGRGQPPRVASTPIRRSRSMAARVLAVFALMAQLRPSGALVASTLNRSKALDSTRRPAADRVVAPAQSLPAPPLVSMEMVVYRGRRLVTVSPADDLASALAGGATTIELEAGTYTISSTLVIPSRDVTIKVKVPGSVVVLDGEGETRIMRKSGPGKLHLIGLTFKNGYVSACHTPPWQAHRRYSPAD